MPKKLNIFSLKIHKGTGIYKKPKILINQSLFSPEEDSLQHNFFQYSK